MKIQPRKATDSSARSDARSPRLRHAAGAVTAGAVVQLAVQLALQIVLARMFGARADMDAYVAAMTLPAVASALLHGAITSAVVPALAEARHARGPGAASRLGTALAVVLLSVLVVPTVLVALNSSRVVALLQPGFTAESQAATARLLAVLAWLFVINGFSALLQAWHQSEGRFALPALAGVLGVALTLAWTLSQAPQRGIIAVAEGVVFGSALGTAMLVGSLAWRRDWQRPTDTWRAIRPLAVRAAPLVAIGCVAQLDPLVDRFLASWLPEGNISHLGYATRITAALQLLTVSSLSMAVFPRLAQHAASHRHEELAEEIRRALRYVVLWLMPLSAALVLFGRPLIHDLFERGAFGAADTRAVAQVLAASIGWIAATAFGEFLSKAFYAQGQSRLPLLIGSTGIALAIAFKFAFIDRFGLVTLPLGSSLGTAFTALLLGLMLSRSIGRLTISDAKSTLARSCVATGAAVATGYAIMALPLPAPALVAGVAGLLIYGVTLALLGESAITGLIGSRGAT